MTVEQPRAEPTRRAVDLSTADDPSRPAPERQVDAGPGGSGVLPEAPVPDPRVGVVVLTYNRRDEVARTVERLVSLPERPRVVVVDNGSTDGTPAFLARRFPEVRCVALTDNPGAAGRNVGVAACGRPYVAFCDDDVWWEPGSLRRAADLFDAYPRLAVICGRVLVGAEGRVDPTCDVMAASPIQADSPLPGPPILGFLAGASVVRRSAFLAAGGFERRFFIGGEEELLTLDLVDTGWELAYVADVVAHHEPSQAGRDNARRRAVMTRNRLWVAWLRRPFRAALARTAATAWAARHDRAARAGLVEAAWALPWALSGRRVIGERAERRVRELARGGGPIPRARGGR